MTKLGDDLVQSLNEALAHAKGEGPGIVHALESRPGSVAGDAEAGAGNATDEAD